MRRFAKALTAAGAACGVTAAAISTGHLTDPATVAGVITAWAGVVGVYWAPYHSSSTDSSALD